MKIKPTHYQVQVKIFEIAGCVYVRTKGNHVIYHYPGAIRQNVGDLESVYTLNEVAALI